MFLLQAQVIRLEDIPEMSHSETTSQTGVLKDKVPIIKLLGSTIYTYLPTYF